MELSLRRPSIFRAAPLDVISCVRALRDRDHDRGRHGSDALWLFGGNGWCPLRVILCVFRLPSYSRILLSILRKMFK